MSRLEGRFRALREASRVALIPYIAAGHPRPELTVPIMHALAGAGADVIELGVPFSDPMADGPVIQRASEAAIANGVGLTQVLEMVERFRTEDQHTPVVLMGYANPIERMGIEAFADAAARVDVDGVLVVDYPPEESVALAQVLESRAIDPIFLIAPTTTAARIALIARHARGYIYYVALKGTTGAGHLDLGELERRLPEIRRQVSVPIGVGFGIRDAASAQAVARLADAVVIGSRIIEELEHASPPGVIEAVASLVKGLRLAVDARAEFMPESS